MPRLVLLQVQAQALAALGRDADAADVATTALGLTRESDINAGTARLYEVRAQWRINTGDSGGRQDLAHAIALDLAFGATRRAAELSEYFLPEVEAPTQGSSERSRERLDAPQDRPHQM